MTHLLSAPFRICATSFIILSEYYHVNFVSFQPKILTVLIIFYLVLISRSCITMWSIFSFVIIFSHVIILLIRSLKLGVVPGATTSLGSCPPFVCTIRNAIVEVSNFSWNDKRSRQGRESSILTRCCLSPLSGDGGTPGYFFFIDLLNIQCVWVMCFKWASIFCFCRALLRKLHLYNIERMDNASLGAALSACPSLLDLEIVGL